MLPALTPALGFLKAIDWKKPGTIILIVLLILIGGYIIYTQYTISSYKAKNNRLTSDLASYELSKQIQNDTIERLVEQSKIDSEQRILYQKRIQEIENKYNEETKKIWSQKGRLKNVTIKKPGQVKRIINDSLNDIMRDFQEATTNTND